MSDDMKNRFSFDKASPKRMSAKRVIDLAGAFCEDVADADREAVLMQSGRVIQAGERKELDPDFGRGVRGRSSRCAVSKIGLRRRLHSQLRRGGAQRGGVVQRREASFLDGCALLLDVSRYRAHASRSLGFALSRSRFARAHAFAPLHHGFLFFSVFGTLLSASLASAAVCLALSKTFCKAARSLAFCALNFSSKGTVSLNKLREIFRANRLDIEFTGVRVCRCSSSPRQRLNIAAKRVQPA